MNTLSKLLFAVAVAAATTGLACASSDPGPARDHEGDGEGGEMSAAVAQAVGVDRTILPLPGGSLSAADLSKFVPLPEPPPVLTFHQICPDTCLTTDKYAMSRTEFARTMLMLKTAGYTSISPAQYLKYVRADWVGLPEKPILITFDDGRLDAYQGADAILQATGMRATMFVITNRPDANLGYMTWAEIAAAQASGRWDMQLHAHAGHAQVPVTVDGSVVSKPLYSYRLDGESFAQWKARVEGDILTGMAMMKARVPGYQPLLFACPYPTAATNDPAILVELSAFLTARFGAWFGDPPLDFTVVGNTKNQPRYTIINPGNANTIYAWLRTQTTNRARTPAF